jgi:hypothetical protein
MKVFADGAMYTKPANWTNKPEQVVRTVGSAALPSRPLVEYSLSIPGIHTAIIGTAQIDADPKSCQLMQNLAAAQIAVGALSAADRRAIEATTASVKDGKTNYFQLPAAGLTAPREASAKQEMRDGKRVVSLEWQTAYAGDQPIARYEIYRDKQKLGQVAYRPQVSLKPILFEDRGGDKAARTYRIETVDASGRTAATEDLQVAAAG